MVGCAPAACVAGGTVWALWLLHRRGLTQRVVVLAPPEPSAPPAPEPSAKFFADKDSEGLLRINLRFVDNFLRWECGRALLAMNLFPNTKEITE